MKKKHHLPALLCSLLLLCVCFSFAQKNKNSLRDSLFAALYAQKNDSMIAAAYNDIARELFMPNYPDSMVFYAKKGAAAVNSNKSWKANLINSVGVGFFYKSEIDSALHYYLEALKIREEVGREKQIISSLNNVAVIYQIKGDLERALEYYFKVLRFRERSKDQKGISNICENIANLYMERSEPRMALSYQLRTKRIRQELKDTFGVAQISLNMANAYEYLDLLDSMVYLVRTNLPILVKHDEANYLGQAYNILGIFYSKTNNNKLAINYFSKAKECYNRLGDMVNAVGEQLNIGVAKMDLGDHAGAYADCGAALVILEEVQHFDKLRHCYKCMYKASKALQKDKEALAYHEKYVALNDSMIGKERIKEITKIEMNHEYSKMTELAELKHKKDIEIREQEKRNQKLVIYFTVLGLVALVLFAFFIVNRLKLTKQQNRIIEQQKKDVEFQKAIIEDKQKEIIDSINYAKRIQSALLAHEQVVNSNLMQSFIYFRPKDIVSGDFYWATEHNDKFYLAACDSTGHGVPGAFMSLLNIGFLSEAINEKNITQPHEILNYVRKRLIDGISKEGQKDGFDGILLCKDRKSGKISYAAAHNAPILIRNNQIVELPKDKMPVGIGEKQESFSLHEIELEKDDTLYLYTDGYADQFGGPKGKKFLYKKLNDLLASLGTLGMKERSERLNREFETWKGELEQVDDVLVIGIQV